MARAKKDRSAEQVEWGINVPAREGAPEVRVEASRSDIIVTVGDTVTYLTADMSRELESAVREGRERFVALQEIPLFAKQAAGKE
jgi:hypothetical protein